jgi:lipopolysaccharide export system protein LptA
MRLLKKLSFVIAALLTCLSLSAQSNKQEDKDSLVVLLSSKSAQMVDVEGARYRKVIGPARFLHNNTYLICDTALWNVESQIIDAWGNVSILQEETVLTSDNLQYLIEMDLAKFRGSVVQLTDKDHNTLRTRHLDYNTKDSVAIFMNGGSMRDKDGQIIESRSGSYDSKVNTFTFANSVNMFTDSVFVKTNNLVYESDLNLATFSQKTDAWKEDNMLSANSGWYDRGREVFFFNDNVHVMSEDQEGWADSLYFYRNTLDVEMLGNAQLTDTTRNVFALAGRIHYMDSLSKVTLTRKPAVISQTEEQDGTIDTVYLGADKLVYYTLLKGNISPAVMSDAESRLKSLAVDPVGEFRRKAAQEAAKAAAEAAKNDPNRPPQGGPGGPGGQLKGGPAQGPAQGPSKGTARGGARARTSAAPPQSTFRGIAPMMPDSLSRNDSISVQDSLPAVPVPSADTLAVSDSVAVSDSLAVQTGPIDSTKIGFLEAIGKVKIYKKNMQVVCDSLLYSDLDSLARLFKEPLIWQEVNRQYTADSVSLVVKNNAMDKASLMSNAFITIQEDTSHFDQIKGAEMLAYFDEKGNLKRFDVLGGASALFFLEENGTLATVNKTDSKMLSAIFKDGEIQRIYYFDAPKNDGYPVVQLADEESKLKGFNWQPEKRPADRNAVTPLSLRPSQRLSYNARPRAQFKQTDIYFPGYMNDVYRQIEVRDSLRQVREREKAIAERQAEERARLDSLALKDTLMVGVDSLAAGMDSLSVADSLLVGTDSLAISDTLRPALKDSLGKVVPEVSDSLAVNDTTVTDVLTPEEQAALKKAEEERLKAEAKAEKEKIKAEKKAALEAKKKKKQEEREARWAELDKRDADKAAAKEAKRLEKERKRKRKALEDAARQAEKDAAALEKFRLKYEKRKAKEDAKAARKSAKSLRG